MLIKKFGEMVTNREDLINRAESYLPDVVIYFDRRKTKIKYFPAWAATNCVYRLIDELRSMGIISRLAKTYQDKVADIRERQIKERGWTHDDDVEKEVAKLELTERVSQNMLRHGLKPLRVMSLDRQSSSHSTDTVLADEIRQDKKASKALSHDELEFNELIREIEHRIRARVPMEKQEVTMNIFRWHYVPLCRGDRYMSFREIARYMKKTDAHLHYILRTCIRPMFTDLAPEMARRFYEDHKMIEVVHSESMAS